MKKKTKTLLLCISIFVVAIVAGLGFLYLNWRKNSVGSGNVLGVAWYDEDGSDFTITTADELYEFAELSGHYDFKGQTIKLGADIVVNEGDAADWEFVLPERLWYPITGFAGIFDGQGHTISGLCGMGDQYGVNATEILYYPTGLFSDTQVKCQIKNLKLVNSFFLSDLNQGVGSISSHGGGKFENIYSNAIIVSYKSGNGGIIGMLSAKGSNSISNCWFDGEIRVEGTYGRYNGGIVGRVCDTGGQNKIEHCLNTGKLSSTVTGKGINMGGLIGNVAPIGRVSVADSLAVGDLKNEYGVSVGVAIGCVEGNASANITDVYARKESFKNIVGAVLGTTIGTPIGFGEDMLMGYEGYRWTTLDFDNYWAVVEDGTPILKTFAKEVPSLKKVKRAFSMDWYDKTKSTYTLKTLEDLYGFAIMSYSSNFMGKTIKLGADIVVNDGKAAEWDEKAPEAIWIPIGTTASPFAGIFDGDMHAISGIYYKTDAPYGGMFPATTPTTTIKNLKLMNSYFESSAQYFGSVVGNARGKFDTIYSNATVVSNAGIVGGMIGQVAKDGGVSMTNCWFDGTVVSKGNTTASRRAAGLAAFVLADTNISNCLNTGTIDITAYATQNSATSKVVAPLAGGLIGHIYKDRTVTLTDCLGTGKVFVSDKATVGYGSVVGYSDGTAILSGTYATKESCKNSAGGKLAGLVIPMSEVELEGVKGYQWTHLDFEKYWAAIAKDTPVLKAFASSAMNVANAKKQVDISWYNKDKNSFVLTSREDLYGFYLLSYSTNFEGKTVKLGKNIVVNTGNAADWGKKAPTYAWKPIGGKALPFAGTFDGQMYTISGLYLKTDERYAGLFGVLDHAACVKKIKLANSYFESSDADIGSIAGWSKGNLDTVYSDAIVKGSTGRIGGLVGQVNGKEMTYKNCWFDGIVSNSGNTKADQNTGGLVGILYAGKLTMNNCLNSGTVDVSTYTFDHNTSATVTIAPIAGGLIGYVVKGTEATVSDSVNTGLIKVSNVANTGYGSIFGHIDGKAKASNAYATKESCVNAKSGTVNGTIKVVSEDDIRGYKGYQWTLLDFDKHWAVVIDNAPVLRAFANPIVSLAGVEKMIDISWYDAKKDVYVLKDKGDLYGFATLSQENDFKDKIIQLDADIIVNENIAKPDYEWTPIGNGEVQFAGIFDGNMHTISGLFLSSTSRYTGLFAATAQTSVVKDLKLTNSYFKSTEADLGSIAGLGRGRFERVYSNATVVATNGRSGGMLGQANGSNVILRDCWFDGSITNTTNHKDLRGTGGLVGIAFAGKLTVDNCLNTGVVDVSVYNTAFPAGNVLPVAGGIIGRIAPDMTVKMEGTFNKGQIKTNTKATGAYGAILGYSDKANALSVTDTYVLDGSCATAAGSTIKGRTFTVTEDSIKGFKGYQWTLLDFENHWAVVKDASPTLKVFAQNVPSLENLEKMIDFSWYDEKKDTYELADKADLYGFAMLSSETDYKGKTIKLTKDIVVNTGDASKWATKAPEYAWTAVGTRTLPFAGTFDGNMHRIEGIYVNTNEKYSGLFGVVGSNATVKNLKLTNSYFQTSTSDFGSITGRLDGTLDNIYTDAIVVGRIERVGGFVGITSGSKATIKNCWFAGSVKNTANHNINRGTGGFVGAVWDGKMLIENCLNTGRIDASSYVYVFPGTNVIPVVGGFVGQVKSGAKLTVNTSLNAGSIVVSDKATLGYGPIVGYNDKADGTATSAVFATKESCAYVNKSNMSATVTQVNFADIKGTKAETKMAAFGWNETWVSVEGLHPVLKPFATEMVDTSWYDAEKDTFTLKDKADLYGFAVLSQKNNFAGKTVKLGKDIVVNKGDANDWANGAPGFAWLPISSKALPFAGTFDGQMHTISGLYLSETVNSNVGLFCTTKETSTVKNLRLTNSYFVSTKDNIGSVVGQLRGTLDTVYSNAIVEGSSARVGGLVGMGYTKSVVVKNCWFDGTVTCTANHINYRGTGGIMGSIYDGSTMTMTNCLNTGTVDASAYTFDQSSTSTPNVTVIVGGLVGWAKSASTKLTVEKCLNLGDVLVSESVTGGYGLIVGFKEGTVTIKETYATTGDWTETMISKSYMKSNFTQVKEDKLLGDKAKDTLKEFDFDKVWESVTDKLPILKAFK